MILIPISLPELVQTVL